MKKTRRQFLEIGIVGTLSGAPIPSFAGGGVTGGATEITQIANNVQLGLQYAKQIQQYALQLQQWQNMLKNTLNIPNQIWSSVQADIMGVVGIVKQGQALAFSLSNIGEQFKQKFPGYIATADFVGDYKKWSTTLRDTIKGTLEAASLQASQFSSEEGVLAGLRGLSASNEGRMQAVQTGNQIAVEVAAQIQKLRALSLAQMQSQNAYMAKQEQEKDTENASVDKMFRKTPIENTRSYKNY